MDVLLSAMHHARYVYDVSHVVIDNLQFMLSGQGRVGADKWEIQDNAVSLLRRFATQNQVHISLVVHPRKEDREQLELNSVFGSVKVVQEADSVIMIQSAPSTGNNNPSFRYLDIKKNRYAIACIFTSKFIIIDMMERLALFHIDLMWNHKRFE